jgi:hypothetical protein
MLLLYADDVIKGVAGMVQNKAAEAANAASDTVQGGLDAASQRAKVGNATYTTAEHVVGRSCCRAAMSDVLCVF